MPRALPAPKPSAVAEILRENLLALAPASLIEALIDRMETRK